MTRNVTFVTRNLATVTWTGKGKGEKRKEKGKGKGEGKRRGEKPGMASAYAGVTSHLFRKNAWTKSFTSYPLKAFYSLYLLPKSGGGTGLSYQSSLHNFVLNFHRFSKREMSTMINGDLLICRQVYYIFARRGHLPHFCEYMHRACPGGLVTRALAVKKGVYEEHGPCF